MALGVAYGLHLTNRFTEEEGPLQIRMMKAISTTGRAIMLSALTTMIGFGSLMYTNLDPVFTVGFSLTLGIFVCLITTFVMSPAIAVWTGYDHKKVESEWNGVARLVTKRSGPVLAGCIVLMLISLVIALPLIKTNIDYLELLRVFWESHDPTQGMRQGNDIGTQYRSSIYTLDSDQAQLATESKQHYGKTLAATGRSAITTEIAAATAFYYAEDYHQQYLSKNPAGYCGLGSTGVRFS